MLFEKLHFSLFETETKKMKCNLTRKFGIYYLKFVIKALFKKSPFVVEKVVLSEYRKLYLSIESLLQKQDIKLKKKFS